MPFVQWIAGGLVVIAALGVAPALAFDAKDEKHINDRIVLWGKLCITAAPTFELFSPAAEQLGFEFAPNGVWHHRKHRDVVAALAERSGRRCACTVGFSTDFPNMAAGYLAESLFYNFGKRFSPGGKKDILGTIKFGSVRATVQAVRGDTAETERALVIQLSVPNRCKIPTQ